MPNQKRKILRVSRSKAEAQKYYNALSTRYDRISGRFEKRCRDRAIELLGAQQGDTLLEVGFGTGHGLLGLADAAGDAGRVFGIDISAGMLEVSKQRLKSAQCAGRVELTVGDALFLPYEEGTFDGILMTFTLELFDTPEIPGVLSECVRVLKPGGKIAVASLSKEHRTLLTRMYESLHTLFPKQLDCRPIYGRRLLEEAGFRIVSSSLYAQKLIPVEVILASR